MAAITKSTDSSSLAEVISIILDKGIVIDVWATVSLVGIQILSVEARVVIASVETYLKYAAAIGLTATSSALHEGKNAALPMPAPAMAAAGVPAAAMGV
ncbi:MAG TPA: gas vesicle protein GvpJ [Archangium sp.]|nr:gas vesicle protein GvpJ [Archangium sp.]HEX5754692.1 gas vesicle protein GvpJ [Archangium sp.]